MDFLSISNQIFTACVACKNLVRNRQKIPVRQLDFLNQTFQNQSADEHREGQLRKLSLLYPNGPDTIFNWLSKVEDRREDLTVLIYIHTVNLSQCIYQDSMLLSIDQPKPLECSPYMNGPSKLPAQISRKPIFGLKLCFQCSSLVYLLKFN